MYKVVGDQVYLLRQSIPSINCLVENDGKTVSADVLESTFSVPRGKYFIEVDNNFVRDDAHNEPLLGIRENVWKFMTEEKKDTFEHSTTGLLRLTSNGTQAFDNLSQDGRQDFLSTLLSELSYAAPVARSRLIIERTHLDNSLYLIFIGIKETRNLSDNNIINIINIMIKNKDQTPIGLGQVTCYLDESYGFTHMCEYFCENNDFILTYVQY